MQLQPLFCVVMLRITPVKTTVFVVVDSLVTLGFQMNFFLLAVIHCISLSSVTSTKAKEAPPGQLCLSVCG